MKTKKTVAVVLALVMLLCLSSTSAFATNEGKEPVTIEWLCWGAAEASTTDAFHAMVDGFMEKYDWITVEITECNYDAVSSTLMTRAAGHDAPDVAQVSNQWVAAMYEMNALRPIDDIVPAETMSDFYAGAKAGTTIGGKLYSAPWIMQPIVMYWNKDLVEAAGFDGPPTTWDEYLKMSEAIAALKTNADGNVVYGRSLASTVLTGAGYFSLIDVWNNGGDFCDADGNISFYSDGTVAAYTELQKMAEAEILPTGLQLIDTRTLFANGQVGLHFDAPTQTKTFSTTNFGVAPVAGGNTFSSDHHLVCFADTEHPEEVGLFIDYLTGPEGMKIYTDHNDVVPARTSVEDLDFYSHLDDNMQVCFSSAATARSLPVQSSHFAEAMQLIAEGLQRVVISFEDVDSVIAEVDSGLKAMYGQ